jgi:putative membrane protein
MRTHGRRMAVVALALALNGSAVAQSRSAGTSGSAGSSSGAAATKGAQKMDEDLQGAVQKLHASNLGEVKMGQLAAQSAQSPEVKQFAHRMVDDHDANDRQLQQLASTMGASLEGDAFRKKQDKAQKDMQKLQGKQGADFDKAYMKAMVEEHEADVEEVESAAKDARKKKQPELAAFLEQTHSHLKTHLADAKRVEEVVRKGGARAGSGTTGGASSGTGSGGMHGTAGEIGTGAGTGPGTGSTGTPGAAGSRGGTSESTGGDRGTGGSGAGSTAGSGQK